MANSTSSETFPARTKNESIPDQDAKMGAADMGSPTLSAWMALKKGKADPSMEDMVYNQMANDPSVLALNEEDQANLLLAMYAKQHPELMGDAAPGQPSQEGPGRKYHIETKRVPITGGKSGWSIKQVYDE